MTDLTLSAQKSVHGEYNPFNIQELIKKQTGQAYFALEGSAFYGSEGSATYFDISQGKPIEFIYECPIFSSNNVGKINNTVLSVNFYATNKNIQWNPDGSNWGPPNNFPLNGHPLYILFVVSSLQ